MPRTKHLRLFAASPTRKPNAAANSVDAHVVANNEKEMEIRKIQDGKGGNYTIITTPDVERVNPIEYYSKLEMTSDVFLLKEELMRFHRYSTDNSILDEIISKKVKENWEERYQEIINTEIPLSLKKILVANKKKDQVKLLRGLSLNSDELMAFIFYAWNKHGFAFSQYRAEHQRKGLAEGELPTFAYIEDGIIDRIGESNLTDGELKQAIEQRTVVVSKFFDKDNEWHCFFSTYNSLKGEENWQNGQPHFHYISNRFGIPRDKVVESLKSRYYTLGSLPHIKITDCGN